MEKKTYLVTMKDGAEFTVDAYTEIGAINEAVSDYLEYETSDVMHVELLVQWG